MKRIRLMNDKATFLMILEWSLIVFAIAFFLGMLYLALYTK